MNRNSIALGVRCNWLVMGVVAVGMFLAGCGGGGGSVGSELGGGDSEGGKSSAGISSMSAAEAASRGYAPHYGTELNKVRRWPSTHLRVFVKDEAETTGRDPVALLHQAFQLWQEATRGEFSFQVVATAEEADMVVRIVPSYTLPNGAVGHTTVTFSNPGDVLSHADILIGGNYSDEATVQIAAHELGHALGMSGHSGSSSDLMYPMLQLPVRISGRDLNTLFWGYAGSGASRATDTGSLAAPTASGSTEKTVCFHGGVH